MPCSSTPADRLHLAMTVHSMQPSARKTTSAPQSVSFRGSITRPASPLCTLRSRDHSRSTQHSVPVGGYPLPGQDFHPRVLTEGFDMSHPSTYHPPSPGLTWRTFRGNVCWAEPRRRPAASAFPTCEAAYRLAQLPALRTSRCRSVHIRQRSAHALCAPSRLNSRVCASSTVCTGSTAGAAPYCAKNLASRRA